MVDEPQISIITKLIGKAIRVFVCGVRESHERKEKTIFITAQNKTHYEDFVDEIVLLPSLRHLNHGNVISPQFPILLMLDIWYSYYVGQDKYAKEVMHDNTLKALTGEEQHRYY